MNSDKHAAQFPQFKASLDAATRYSDANSSSTAEYDYMAANIRRARQAAAGLRRRRVSVATLGDNEMIGTLFRLAVNQIFSNVLVTVSLSDFTTWLDSYSLSIALKPQPVHYFDSVQCESSLLPVHMHLPTFVADRCRRQKFLSKTCQSNTLSGCVSDLCNCILE